MGPPRFRHRRVVGPAGRAPGSFLQTSALVRGRLPALTGPISLKAAATELIKHATIRRYMVASFGPLSAWAAWRDYAYKTRGLSKFFSHGQSKPPACVHPRSALHLGVA